MNFFLSKLILLWLKSLRVTTQKLPDNSGIIGLWHQDLPACMVGFSNRQILVMISSSKDGELASLVANSLGYTVQRGSSHKNASAIRILLRQLLQNKWVGMTLDGPAGPAKISKKGCFWLAENSTKNIIHPKITYSYFIKIKSWDQMIIPLPFSKIIIEWKTFPGTN